MSESKHTPGPWECPTKDVIRTSDKGQFIADSTPLNYLNEWRSKEQQEADARLIAAAPELLEACELAKGLIKMAQETFEEGELDIHVLEYIEAAIAKAKGE